jgi:hypothetical protein
MIVLPRPAVRLLGPALIHCDVAPVALTHIGQVVAWADCSLPQVLEMMTSRSAPLGWAERKGVKEERALRPADSDGSAVASSALTLDAISR